MPISRSATSTPERWLGYEDAAVYLGCTQRQLKRWVSQKRITHTRLGQQTQFSREALDEFIAVNTFAPVPR
jgi:excisionase family DNA binding protein